MRSSSMVYRPGGRKLSKLKKEQAVKKQVEDSIELKRYLQREPGLLIDIADKIVAAVRKGKRVFLFGNGGSAADAQHIAGELAGRFYRDREPLPAMSLNTNTSIITAIGNDYGYEEVFARQVRALVNKGDVVIGLSTSGNSANVIQGIQAARELGAVTVVFTGRKGKLAGMSDLALCVPSTDTPRIQEAHITAGHIICYLVEEALFAGKKVK